MTTPAAGWYQDPQNASMKRYWDGSQWTEQTQLAAAVPPPPPSSGQTMPKKYLVESILATIFCCLPFGVAGIVFSSKVESLWRAGAYAEAHEASRKAKMFSVIALWLGIAAVVVQVLLVVFSASSQPL
jgi:hypothetical protein